MSVSTEAEKDPVRTEKREVRAWTAASLPNPSSANADAEKEPKRVETFEVWPGVPASRPESLEFHWVQPYELERLTHIEKPFSLAIAAATTGCALGMTPLVNGALAAVHDLSKTTNDSMLWYLIYAMIFALSVGISIIAWINAWCGRGDARKMLEELKQRPKILLSQIPHQ
jgi:hypothetical protein